MGRIALGLLIWGVQGLLSGVWAAATATALDPTPACDWRSGPLSEVVTFGLYLYQTGPLDSIWEQSFPTLLADKDHNYRCLQQVFERGPRIIPGLEAQYRQWLAESKKTAPPLQNTGTSVAPVLVFLEPVKGGCWCSGSQTHQSRGKTSSVRSRLFSAQWQAPAR